MAALAQLTGACCELVRRARRSGGTDADDIVQDACVHVLQLAAPQSV